MGNDPASWWEWLLLLFGVFTILGVIILIIWAAWDWLHGR